MHIQETAKSLQDFIEKKLNIPFNLYAYGSHVYGTNNQDSDCDFQLILPDEHMTKENMGILQEANKELGVDGTISSLWYFNMKLTDHDVAAVETSLLQPEFRYREDFALTFTLDLPKLRNSFSHVASNSWVKAKKKLTVEKDYNELVARKSLFHSFRILDLGVQIATGADVKFDSMNNILEEVNSLPSNWDLWDATFRARHNALKTKFREVCPK